MPLSTRFAVAIHTAGMIAVLGEREPVTSEAVAKSVDTNPVVVRRVIAMLARRGLVCVRKGQHGGATLARPPESIRLDEIYRAVEPDPLFAVPLQGAHNECPVARCVGAVLERFFHRAETGMLATLHGMTLADVVESVKERAGCLPSQRKKSIIHELLQNPKR
jgi:Rrf2 family protein